MSTVNQILIHLPSIQANLRTMKSKAPGAKALAVVKANAYGLGAQAIASYLEPEVDGFCVALPEEAKALINSGIRKPILCLGYLDESWFPYVIDQQVRTACYSLDRAKKLSDQAQALGKKAYIHLALDTGHARLGFAWDDLQLVPKIQAVAALPDLEIRGIFSHFACADDPGNPLTPLQFHRFQEATQALQAEGIDLGVRHIANSAALFLSPDYALDAVRLGICLYGEYPSRAMAETWPGELLPTFSLQSRVSYVKTIQAGDGVGYGQTWQAERKTRLATVSIGYADGYPRSLSNRGQVLIHSQACPVVGRVCMDQLMVDVTEIDPPEALEEGWEGKVHIGDTVVLMGRDPYPGKEIDMTDLADLAGTIPYELMTGIGPRVDRVYFD